MKARLGALALTLVLALGCDPGTPPADGGPPPDGSGPDAGPLDAGPRFDDTGLRPSGRFAEIWGSLSRGEGPLGYPLADPLGAALCAWQPFERGWMTWVEARSIREGCIEFCDDPRIFSVVWPGGDSTATMGDRYTRAPDQFVEGTGPFFCDEADRTEATVGAETKPIGPIRGFGRVWCQTDGVRADLGRATAPERGGGSFLTCESQLFQGGLIIHNPNAEDASFWVYLDDGRWRRFPE